MERTKESVINDVKRYIEVLKANGITVQRALLFGFWAKGVAQEESDVDVALISSFFPGIDSRIVEESFPCEGASTSTSNLCPSPLRTSRTEEFSWRRLHDTVRREDDAKKNPFLHGRGVA